MDKKNREKYRLLLFVMKFVILLNFVIIVIIIGSGKPFVEYVLLLPRTYVKYVTSRP